MFFDTTDGLAPNVAGTNLTPAISVSGGGWNTAGFLYVNSTDWSTSGVGSGVNRTVVPPGEPGDGSGFVNFDYPSSLTSGYTIRDGTVNFETFQDPVTNQWYCTDASQCDATTRTPAGGLGGRTAPPMSRGSSAAGGGGVRCPVIGCTTPPTRTPT